MSFLKKFDEIKKQVQSTVKDVQGKVQTVQNKAQGHSSDAPPPPAGSQAPLPPPPVYTAPQPVNPIAAFLGLDPTTPSPDDAGPGDREMAKTTWNRFVPLPPVASVRMSDEPYAMHGWDDWDYLEPCFGWVPTAKRHIVADGWEGWSYESNGHGSVQVLSYNDQVGSDGAQIMRPTLPGGRDLPGPLDEVTLMTIARDHDGHATALAVINSLVLIVRIINPSAGVDDLDQAYNTACEAIISTPE